MKTENLIKIIDYLRVKKIIRYDADIAKVTGYNKSVVSSYIKGKLPVSDAFYLKVKDAFNITKELEQSIINETFDNIKTKLEKQGYSKELPIVSSNHSNLIEITTASTASALLSLMCEVISNQTKEPLEQVKERATALMLTQQQKIEGFLKSML